MMREVVLFDSLYRERVWGGRSLENLLGRSLPGEGPIGESWDVVDRPEAQSVVRSGSMKGRTLRWLIENETEDVMGRDWKPADRFPIMVKWLDCRKRLSLQVHPPAHAASELEGEPKTEHWFVAETSPGAHLIAGLKRGVSREQFERALGSGDVEACVHRFPVKAGDALFVPSGRVHAIDAGCLILEIQQNSDTTFRVFDWGRVGIDGKPRSLHVEKSLRSIDWGDFEPEPQRGAPTSSQLVACPEFRIRRVVLARGERLSVGGGQEPRLLSVVGGRVHAGATTLIPGDTALLPFAGDFNFLAGDPVLLLLTEGFASRGEAPRQPAA
jgi:mannose-6-phosphate isomerase